MEGFQRLVPAQIKTVIVTVGTLEAHGFVNNGADNTVPVAIANAVASDVDALIAPHIPYGVTDILAPFPGSLHIPEDAFRIYVRAVLVGLVNNGFRNIVILNGHGPQVPVLQQLANEISLQYKVNTLLINWWLLANDITRQFFGEDGGHATNDETAMVQAANPKLVHWELFYGRGHGHIAPQTSGWLVGNSVSFQHLALYRGSRTAEGPQPSQSGGVLSQSSSQSKGIDFGHAAEVGVSGIQVVPDGQA